MIRNNNTGHAKNIANFELLKNFCESLAGQYNPTNGNISLSNINAKFASASSITQQLRVEKATYDGITNAREVEFSDVKKLSTRVTNAFSVCGASEQAINDVKTLNRKIQGRKKKSGESDEFKNKPKDLSAAATTDIAFMATENPEPERTHSIQSGYDATIDYFSSMIEILRSETLYQPSEVELTIDKLEGKKNQLVTVNSAVLSAIHPMNRARIERNRSLYEPKLGLVPMALEIKNYLKSIFGARGEEIKQIISLKFTNKP